MDLAIPEVIVEASWWSRPIIKHTRPTDDRVYEFCEALLCTGHVVLCTGRVVLCTGRVVCSKRVACDDRDDDRDDVHTIDSRRGLLFQ